MCGVGISKQLTIISIWGDFVINFIGVIWNGTGWVVGRGEQAFKKAGGRTLKSSSIPFEQELLTCLSTILNGTAE